MKRLPYLNYIGKPLLIDFIRHQRKETKHFIRYYRIKIPIYKMLSRDIETVLGGRYLDISVFPYSFSEYLKAVGVLLSKNWQYGRKANELQRNFRTYFDWGGDSLSLYIFKKREYG